LYGPTLSRTGRSALSTPRDCAGTRDCVVDRELGTSSPTWSVARALAGEGLRGLLLRPPRVREEQLLRPSRRRLHADHVGTTGTSCTTIVGEVKSGGYSTTSGSDCSGPQQPSTMQNRLVVIIGHSAGGWIVAGYPGKYHDVGRHDPDRHLGLDLAAAELSAGKLLGRRGSPPALTIPTTSSSSRPARIAGTSTPTRLESSPYVVDHPPALPPFLLSPLGRESPTSARSTPRTTPTSARSGLRFRCCSPPGITTAPPRPSVAKADYDYYKASLRLRRGRKWIVPDNGAPLHGFTSRCLRGSITSPNWLTLAGNSAGERPLIGRLDLGAVSSAPK